MEKLYDDTKIDKEFSEAQKRLSKPITVPECLKLNIQNNNNYGNKLSKNKSEDILEESIPLLSFNEIPKVVPESSALNCPSHICQLQHKTKKVFTVVPVCEHSGSILTHVDPSQHFFYHAIPLTVSCASVTTIESHPVPVPSLIVHQDNPIGVHGSQSNTLLTKDSEDISKQIIHEIPVINTPTDHDVALHVTPITPCLHANSDNEHSVITEGNAQFVPVTFGASTGVYRIYNDLESNHINKRLSVPVLQTFATQPTIGTTYCQYQSLEGNTNCPYVTRAPHPSSLVPLVSPWGPHTTVSDIYRQHGTPRSVIATLPHGATLPPLHQVSFQSPEKLDNYLRIPGQRPHGETISLSQLTAISATSVDLGCTDGRNLTITGIATCPSQLASSSLKNATVEQLEEAEANSSVEDDVEVPTGRDRIRWKNKVESVLSCVGACVGLTNLWHFPYLCHKHGGGMFLVPYSIMVVACGAPLLLLELVIGQYTKAGPVTALHNICPLFTGVGISSVLLSFISSTHHIVSLTASLLFLGKSMSSQSWEADMTESLNDTIQGMMKLDCQISQKLTNDNGTCDKILPADTPISSNRSELTLRWNNVVLERLFIISRFKGIQMEMLGCFAILLVIVYLSLWKFIRSYARIVYISATLPYILMGVFLYHVLSLPGASVGLQQFFIAKWDILLDINVWMSAASHIISNTRIATGTIIVLSSYKKYNTNVIGDVWIIVFMSSAMSLMAAFIVFGLLGHVSHEQDQDIHSVIAQGPELGFLIFPSTLSQNSSFFWPGLFFLLLFLLGIDSLLATLQVVITTAQDCFSDWIQEHLKKHEVVVALVCIITFIFALPCILMGGKYYFWLMDQHAYGLWAVYLTLFELIAVIGFYGGDRLTNNILEMTGRRPSLYFKTCWYSTAPIVVLAIVIYSLVDYSSLTSSPLRHALNFNKTSWNQFISGSKALSNFYLDSTHLAEMTHTFVYPTWVLVIGWMSFSCVILVVPIVALIIIWKTKGKTLKQKLREATISRINKCKTCGKVVHGSGKDHSCRRFSLRCLKFIHFGPNAANDQTLGHPIDEQLASLDAALNTSNRIKDFNDQDSELFTFNLEDTQKNIFS